MNQFETDLKNFEAQFANTQNNANFIPQKTAAGGPVFGQDATNKRQPTFNHIRPNSFKPVKPVTPRSQPLPVSVTPVSKPTFTKPKVTPFTIFNKPSTTKAPAQPLITTTRKQTTQSRTTTTARTTTVPITYTTTTKKEENKNSKGVSIPVEATTRKPTKIKFTFNGVRML